MGFALVLFHEAPEGPTPQVTEAEMARLRTALRGIAGLAEGLIFTPASASDSLIAAETPPPLGLQLHFDGLESLEAAALADGVLAGLPGLLPTLRGTAANVQAFWRRTWSVNEPNQAAGRQCSYVVHYPGPAQDPNDWHDHYIKGHVPLFQRFPGIRGVEILTGVEWVSHLPQQKVFHMQRNRVTFDSPMALTAALQSPVRHELRADFHTFPPFQGGNFHYPMWVETLHP